MRNNLFITLLLLTISLSCKKQEEEKPRLYPSHAGRNILYCKVNGAEKLYDEKGGGLFNVDDLDAYFRKFPDSNVTRPVFYIHCGEGDHDGSFYLCAEVTDAEIESGIPELNVPRKFIKSNFWVASRYNHRTIDHEYDYILDTTRATITFTRYDDKVIAGTFSFEAGYKDSLHVSVTDGFFDILVED